MLWISFHREFAKEKSRQTKSGKFQKIREKHLVDEALKGYLDWIQQAGNWRILLCLYDKVLMCYFIRPSMAGHRTYIEVGLGSLSNYFSWIRKSNALVNYLWVNSLSLSVIRIPRVVRFCSNYWEIRLVNYKSFLRSF